MYILDKKDMIPRLPMYLQMKLFIKSYSIYELKIASISAFHLYIAKNNSHKA